MNSNPHRLTQILACTLFSVAFLYLNLDGYPTLSLSFPPKQLPELDFYFGETGDSKYLDLNRHVQKSIGRNPPKLTSINWMHGWPFHFVARPSMYSLSAGKGVTVTTAAENDIGYYSRWPIDNAPPFWLLYPPIVANLLVFLMLLWLIWTANAKTRIQISIAKLLVATFIVALAINFRLVNMRFTPHVVAWTLVFWISMASTYRLILSRRPPENTG